MTDNSPDNDNKCEIPKGIFEIFKSHYQETGFFIKVLAVAAALSLFAVAVGYGVGLSNIPMRYESD